MFYPLYNVSVFRLLFVLWLGTSSFVGCMQRLYFVADPYWETATQVSFWQIRQIGLLAGYFVRIVPTTDNTEWLSLAEDGAELSLKNRMEGWLAQDHKVLMSPYWQRSYRDQPLAFTRGQLVLIDAVSNDPKVQSVVSDIAGGYYAMGEIAGNFMQMYPEREQTIALFYRGSSYDRFYESFKEGFQSSNPNAEQLLLRRYYAAEVNEITSFLESLDLAQSLVVLGMAHISESVYRAVSTEEQSRIMVENFGGEQLDPNNQILLSLGTDYRSLVKEAIGLARLAGESPFHTPETANESAEQDAAQQRVVKQPYVLHLPSPELMSDIEPVRELARKAIAAQKWRENRPDVYLARLWDKILDFLANPALPNWLRNFFWGHWDV